MCINLGEYSTSFGLFHAFNVCLSLHNVYCRLTFWGVHCVPGRHYMCGDLSVHWGLYEVPWDPYNVCWGLSDVLGFYDMLS